MSEAPEDPTAYPDTEGKQLHIPGAGTVGIALLIVSLSVLFIASMMAFVVIRIQAGEHWAVGMPRVPNSLWISTAVILCASVTIQMAYNAIRGGGSGAESRLVRCLAATFVIGLVFLLLQTFNWIEFYRSLGKSMRVEGPYLGMFYVLTGLHAAHVVGGLIPLGIVIVRAARGRYSQNFHPGVRYSTIYWHFLDIVWVVVFLSIYF